MSIEESLNHLKFRIETLRGLQIKQIEDMVATYKEIEETKQKIEKIEYEIKEKHELEDK